MWGLLKPGIRVLERVSFARKFQLLFVLFVIPLGYALWVMTSSNLAHIEVLGSEIDGMHGVQALSAVEQELHQQRFLLARWKGNDKAAEALLRERSGKLGEALAAAAEQVKVTPSEETGRQLEALQASVAELDLAVLGKMALLDALERYQKTLSLLTVLREQVATDSGLILDPFLDTYLMMEQLTQTLPRLSDNLGNFASQGYGSLVAQHFTLQNRVVVRDLRRSLEQAGAQIAKSRTALQQASPRAMQTLQPPYAQVEEALQKFLAEVDRDMFEASPMVLQPAQFVQQVQALQENVSVLRQAVYEQFIANIGDYQAKARRDMLHTTLIFAVLTLLALYLLLCLNASIRRSTAGIIQAAEGLRDGDLRVRMQVHGADDLAAIATALNTAVAQMRDSMQGVGREGQSLDETVRTLGSQAAGSLRAVEQQQAQMSQIATAATQMAATAQSVAQSCEQAAQEAGQTREIANQSNQRSARTSASMRELSERLAGSAQTLQKLRQQTEQITRVVDVIKGIAEQTNLLALNAAIEAARAGEQGRGFAVVADEVRSLSQRTQNSTAEIAQTVGDLHKVVGQSVAEMEQAMHQAEGDVGNVLAMSADLDGIVDSVQRVSDRLAQIATAAEQQAATADEVSGNIQQVDEAASELLEGARMVSDACEQLRGGSQSLSRNTGRFRVE
ncbi:methyl-accepting chemotaxis protein [Pseudomonas sp. URMO17WK12:I2]|uniref:methyl-accepting chemotaxis protein n=1 Tax=Pseudomonas sp. URMO17WK12:I2 TaxID=1261623 RepID=UPI000DAC3193|nr:methyl-accepting chemotaxis protein [Pseudomonas sp. URMO17WK12:I2]PZW49843.1 methyl-accepting chemotaxis protein [Pseudomonas sp. URMO17WK12:I2]